MLSEAEEKWTPNDDPIFQLVPPAFQVIVSECYDDLGQPVVTFDTFWEIYCDLRDKVEEAVSEDVAVGLSQIVHSDSTVEGPFALAHLKAPKIDTRNGVDVEGRSGGDDDIFSCEFTVDNDRDELY